MKGEKTGPVPGHDAEDKPTEGLKACIPLKEGTACLSLSAESCLITTSSMI